MNITVNNANLPLFEALSSGTRIKIIELLGQGPKNIGELANAVSVSSAIMTRHISMLEKAGIIQTESIPGKRGLQKVCSLIADDITLSFKKKNIKKDTHTISIPIGQYHNYEANPTCGLASVEGFIGVQDDPRYFSSPDRVNAALLWFQTGFIEYRIPSYMIQKPILKIEISMEICSEFPGFNEKWPSDIYFYLNNFPLGKWISPGDFGDSKGQFTPDWWRAGTQYGLLKNILITDTETMLDGLRLSDTTLDKVLRNWSGDMVLRIEVPKNTEHPGGINLFGKGFGNYNQDIQIHIEYRT